MKLKTNFTIIKSDGSPFYGAYKTGSLNNNEPVVILNIEAIVEAIKEDTDKAQSFKDILLSTITHEFCHSMQEWLDKEYDELEVEKILGAYNEKWNVFNATAQDEESGMDNVFKISEFLDWMDRSKAITFKQFKDEVNEMFKPIILWMDAFKKDKEEKNV